MLNNKFKGNVGYYLLNDPIGPRITLNSKAYMLQLGSLQSVFYKFHSRTIPLLSDLSICIENPSQFKSCPLPIFDQSYDIQRPIDKKFLRPDPIIFKYGIVKNRGGTGRNWEGICEINWEETVKKMVRNLWKNLAIFLCHFQILPNSFPLPSYSTPSYFHEFIPIYFTAPRYFLGPFHKFIPTSFLGIFPVWILFLVSFISLIHILYLHYLKSTINKVGE